jgi:hypothetical protein
MPSAGGRAHAERAAPAGNASLGALRYRKRCRAHTSKNSDIDPKTAAAWSGPPGEFMRDSSFGTSFLHRGATGVAATALLLALAACGNGDRPATAASSPASAASATHPAALRDDPYDASKMDYKTPPAVLSAERHAGEFASGA